MSDTALQTPGCVPTLTGTHLDDAAIIPPAYRKCIKCPDLGRLCGGQKITALRKIETARAYHREMRCDRGILMKQIYAAAKNVSHGTIDDYFGRVAQDFKWTTVAAIDNAMTAICGGTVGQDPIEMPCPAATLELRERCDSLAIRLDEATAENTRLAEALATAEKNAQTRLTNQRADLDQIIKLQQARIAALEAEKADYLARNDRKRTELEAARVEIRELNRANLQITREFAAKMLDMSDKLLAATEK